MPTKNDRPPFMATQTMRLLAETEQPERFLRAEYFRSGRTPASPGLGQPDRGTWIEVDRRDVARNRVRQADGAPCDLLRLVLTTCMHRRRRRKRCTLALSSDAAGFMPCRSPHFSS